MPFNIVCYITFRYNLSYKDRPPSIEILKKSKRKYHKARNSTAGHRSSNSQPIELNLVSSFFDDEELARYEYDKEMALNGLKFKL